MSLPDNWLLLPIADVCDINPRASHNLRDEDLVSFLPMKAVDDIDGIITECEEKPLSEVKKGYTVFQEGDVLFAKITPCMENGKAAVAEGLTNSVGYGSTEFHVLRPHNGIDKHFLHHFIRQTTFRAWAKNSFIGSAGQQRVPTQFFNYAKIPVPPLEEQREIVTTLQEAEKLRRLRQDSLEKAEKLASALFIEMFGNILSNDKNWSTKKFRKIGKRRLGKMLDKGKEQGGQQYPYLANFNVQWNHLNLDELRTMVFSKQDREEFSLQDGDLLICEGGEIGRTAIWKGGSQNIFFQKALHRVRLDTQLTVPEYILHYMWFMAQYGGFRGAGNSATIAHLTGVQLDNLLVPLPPIELQERFAANISDIEKQQQHVRAQLENMKQLLAVLQQQAFNGRLTESWRQSHPHLQAPTIKARHIKTPEETVITHRESLFPQQRNRKAIYDQLSEFQRVVWNYFLENGDKYLPDDMPTIIAELPEAITKKDHSRLQTTLATLTTLGLLKKVSIINNRDEFIPVYRALRDSDEHHLFRDQKEIVASETDNTQSARKRRGRSILL